MPRGSGVTALTEWPQRTVPGAREPSRSARSWPRSISGLLRSSSSAWSWRIRVAWRSYRRHSWLSGRERARNWSNRPAVRRAAWPVSSWMSRVPPCEREWGAVSCSKTVTGTPWCCRTRAQTRPPRPAPTIAIRAVVDMGATLRSKGWGRVLVPCGDALFRAWRISRSGVGRVPGSGGRGAGQPSPLTETQQLQKYNRSDFTWSRLCDRIPSRR